MATKGPNGGRDTSSYEHKQRVYGRLSEGDKARLQQAQASRYAANATGVFPDDPGREQRRNELLLLANARNEERKRQEQLSAVQAATSVAPANEAIASADNATEATSPSFKKRFDL